MKTGSLAQRIAKENTFNLVTNGDFLHWSLGDNVAPDAWVLVGAGASVAKEVDLTKLGIFSCALTRVGSDAYLYQNIHDERGLDYWKGRVITVGCWVWCDVADRACLSIYDGASSISAYHTGVYAWQWLSVTKVISSLAVAVELNCNVLNGDAVAYFSGFMCVEGNSAFAFVDKLLVNSGIILTDSDPTKFSHKIPVYLDGVLYYMMVAQS